MKNKFSRCLKCKKIYTEIDYKNSDRYTEIDYRNSDGVCEKCKNDYKLLKTE